MSESASQLGVVRKPVWYRSTVAAAFILGICNLAAPGFWGAMNSLGAGGQQTPFLVNAANALTFCLMVLTAFLAPVIINKFGVRIALFLGGAGFAPYCAGLYTNNVYGTKWLVLFGAATCGLSAGLFWAVEAAVALSYPEPNRIGLCLGIWLSFRVAGQIIGGAINLGLNADRAYAGAINPNVYFVFIALTSVGAFVAFLLPTPKTLQRKDGRPVRLYFETNVWREVQKTARLFFTKRFLLVVPLITQAVFPESFTNTYMTLHFTVRARALGSFVAGVSCIIVGNIVGAVLDLKSLPLKPKARWTFITILSLQGCWWIWSTVIQADFPGGGSEVVDWDSPYFGRTFALYVFLGAGFQANYLFLYFVIENLISEPADIVRLAGLLRATESAAQAVSYGLSSVKSFSLLGSSSLNFALWGVSLLPAWLVIRRIGVDYFGAEVRDAPEFDSSSSSRVGEADTDSEAAEKSTAAQVAYAGNQVEYSAKVDTEQRTRAL